LVEERIKIEEKEEKKVLDSTFRNSNIKVLISVNKYVNYLRKRIISLFVNIS